MNNSFEFTKVLTWNSKFFFFWGGAHDNKEGKGPLHPKFDLAWEARLPLTPPPPPQLWICKSVSNAQLRNKLTNPMSVTMVRNG